MFHRLNIRALAVLALLSASAAHAQTFTVTPATGSGPRRATWDIPAGTNCQAGGAWSGAKAASGTETLNLAAGSYNFTLACTVPDAVVKASVTLGWQAPTENTDGSALTNLKGYKVFWGKTASTLSNTATVNNAGLVRYTVEDLTAGTWFFGVKAFTTVGTESAMSATVSKAVTDVTTTKSWTGAQSTVVDLAKPKAPVLSIIEPPQP